jgi:hypothetical protein
MEKNLQINYIIQTNPTGIKKPSDLNPKAFSWKWISAVVIPADRSQKIGHLQEIQNGKNNEGRYKGRQNRPQDLNLRSLSVHNRLILQIL